ncbi:Glycosyl transferase family 2 [Marinomonas gallaica]|uniref:Glycosyl transferase family 2 n=1 Tax=Marinomonas gallaica TaxID=1806667 RepID=A0A1C3JUP8_9GAMM|nr:glycosyltransferase [Marinomonas gallaica]SBT18954.1 Glycosyl transferase family 2 [Marinomonas gallaica]SBT21909.1 Glycosyl transferase family 2 [Marinomonas gallaica]
MIYNHVSTASHVIGEFCCLHANALIGWVQAPQQPNKRWAVAIHIDGQQYSLAFADQYLEQSPGDGCHGFRVLIDDQTLNSAKQVSMTLANSDQVLDHMRLSPALVDQSEKLMSRVIWQPGLCLHGWLVDKSEPNAPQWVNVFEGAKKITTARPARWENIDDRYVEAGFLINLPFSLADGKPHTLTITNSKGKALQGSPIVIQEWPRGLKHLLNNVTEQTQVLLEKQVDNYQRLLPSSVRMLDYKPWLEAYSPGYGVTKDNNIVNADSVKSKKKNKAAKAEASKSYITTDKVAVLWLGALPVDLPKARLAQVQHFSFQSKDNIDYQASLKEVIESHQWLIQLPAEARLADNALDRIIATLQEEACQALYSDFSFNETLNGFTRIEAAFLPAYDPDRLWQQDYLFGGGVCAARTELLAELLDTSAGLPKQPEALSYALLYSAHVNDVEAQILHLPEPLLHRPDSWPVPVTEQALQARQHYLSYYDNAMSLNVVKDKEYLSLTRELQQWPDVTLIMPTRNGLKLVKECLDTFFDKTEYPSHVTILVLDNESDDEKAVAYFAEQASLGVRAIGRGTAQVKVAQYPYPFNYSAINNFGVELATTEIIGLLNNDIEVLHADWLCRMVALLDRKETGVVGAKLLWPNGMVQHGGVIGGQYDGLAGHVGNEWQKDDNGYLGMNQITQRFTMVTAACLLLRKADFLRVGMLDERAFPVAFNDVDLCLKMRRLNKAVVWTPNAELIHAESASRGKDDQPEKAARAQREQTQLRQRWLSALMQDPAYNPNLSLNLVNAPYSALALPPRERVARNNQILLQPIMLAQAETTIGGNPALLKENMS